MGQEGSSEIAGSLVSGLLPTLGPLGSGLSYPGV